MAGIFQHVNAKLVEIRVEQAKAFRLQRLNEGYYEPYLLIIRAIKKVITLLSIMQQEESIATSLSEAKLAAMAGTYTAGIIMALAFLIVGVYEARTSYGDQQVILDSE